MLNDLRYAIRWLLRAPGFALVAILSLGLGIGVNTAMFSLVDAVLLRPIPVTDPDTLVDIFTGSSDGDDYATSSYPDFLDLRAQNTVFSDMLGYTPMFAPLGLGDRARLVMGQVVTANHFEMLGVRPLLGRMLTPSDDGPGAERVVVVSHQMWQREFGGNPATVGRALQLRGLSFTIVGVAPPAFTGVIPLIAPELWLPAAHVEEVEPAGINSSVPSPTGNTRLERRGTRWLFIKGRLKPGVSVAQAQAHIALLGAQLQAAHPATNKNYRMTAFATNDVRFLVPQAGGPLSIGSASVMVIVGLVLLIACANVTGMLLARASGRRREISLRLAIGASRAHLLRQLLCEGLVLGVCGAAVAVLLAWGVIRALLGIELPIPGSIGLDLRLDLRVIGFGIAVAVLAGVLAALVPALKASSPRLAGDLRGEAPVGRFGRRRLALRDVLAAGQLALTAVLLVVAGLLLRSLGASRAANVGFQTERVAFVGFDTDMVRYSRERGAQFSEQALARIKAMPEVESVAVVSPRLPFDINYNQTSIRIDGKAYETPESGDTVANVAVSPDYFATLGIPLREGRVIADTDRQGGPLVAIVNETMARRFWEGNAVGRTFRMQFGGAAYRVVGVVGDHKIHAINERPAPYLHFAETQQPNSYRTLVARTRGDAGALLVSMRRALLDMEPGLVFIRSQTMEGSLMTALLPDRVGAVLAAAFGALGTLLAAIGLYGVIAYTVSRRTREIGVRMALGADRAGVLRMVMGQGLALAMIGVTIGFALAALAARFLGGVLYGVGAANPIAWGSALAVLLLAAGVANVIPALRAMRVDPVTALRAE